MIAQRHTRISTAALVLACGLAISPSLDTGHSAAADRSDVVRSQPPRFEISWLRGELRLSGHTFSGRHETGLLQVAASAYPAHTLFTTFKPLGVVPDYWTDTSIQTLVALAGTMSAHAILSVNELVIRGVIDRRSGWSSRLTTLRQSIPASIALHVDVLMVADDFRLADSCRRAVGQFSPGPIHFKKSGTEFRTSAYLPLERIVALANACRKAEISITGHSDASGDETWNQRLSLERAIAVADYIEQGGIARTRLIVAGAGSSEPVADNDTSFGRSLNRRIEVVLNSAQP